MDNLTRKDMGGILLFAGLVILGRYMAPRIYESNDDLRNKRGKLLYARDDMWREGRSSTQPPTIRWNTKVEGLLYDNAGDIVFRFRGQYYVAQRTFFPDVPLDVPPPPEDALTATK